MSAFIFKNYHFDDKALIATFEYGFGDSRQFVEKISFSQQDIDYDRQVLDRALFLAFILIGTSYYKTFPSREVVFAHGAIDAWQADFLNKVYQEGMSQFAYENKLTRGDLAHFSSTNDNVMQAKEYGGEGILSLQSGGKDSLLSAQLLRKNHHEFSVFYISSTEIYPEILNELHSDIVITKRQIDLPAIKQAIDQGGLNGHVPVTFIVLSIALLQAVLLNKQTVLTAIGHEGEEPHDMIGDLPVNHQWAKTWPAEQLFVEFVNRYISADINIGSPLRRYSELKVAELFVGSAWEKFGHSFSSCNLANYEQGHANTTLRWDGTCPKCANAYLLFSPFLDADELKTLFEGQDLFAKSELTETFKGLLDIDGVMKPFECVGEVEELRLAYHKAQEKGGYCSLPFEVPASKFDYGREYPAQGWAADLLR